MATPIQIRGFDEEGKIQINEALRQLFGRVGNAEVRTQRIVGSGGGGGGGGGVIDHGLLTGLGDDDHTQYQKESEREAASGYAGLDASSKVIKDPANATATPTAAKIPIADGSGKLDGWITLGATVDESELALTDVATNDSSTSKHGFLKKLSSTATEYMDGSGAWSTPAGTVLDAPTREKREWIIQQDNLGTQIIVVGINGTGIYTTEGSASAQITSGGSYIQYATAASNGSDGGIVTDWAAPSPQIQTQVGPICTWTIRTGAPITVQRTWIGFFSADPMASDTPSVHLMAFRYSPASDGTAFWRCVTDDGGGAPTVTITTQSIAVGTRYILKIDATNAASIKFYINGTLVATHTTDLPGTSTNIYHVCETRTLEAVAKPSPQFGRLHVQHN